MSVPTAAAKSADFAGLHPDLDQLLRDAQAVGYGRAAGLALRACANAHARRQTAVMLAFGALVGDGALSDYPRIDHGWVATDLYDALFVAYDAGPEVIR